MPNRGELPSPAMRAKSAALRRGTATPDGEAWIIIAFCTIGWLMSFYVAVSSVGVDGFQQVMAQVPLG